MKPTVNIHLISYIWLFLSGIYLNNPAFSQEFIWPINSAQNVGMDQQHIDAAIEQIESGSVGNIQSLIIIKDGQLVTEKYFNNEGEKRPVYSVTKSVGSAMLGIAKHQGAEININDAILNYLPQYSGISNYQQASQIKLHDILTQRHGYNWDEWSTAFSNHSNPVNRMLRASDWYRFALQSSITEAPDQNFTYSTGHSSLMSPIIQNRTGSDVYDYAVSELFQPLNITDTHWELVNGGAAMGSGTSTFPFGIEPLGFGLWLKPIDMAKLGELYLKGGMWGNNRLLSEQWIEQSTQRYSDHQSDPDVFSGSQGYGYQWWITQITDANNRPADMYYANGYGGQFIFVIPQYDAVIVSTANDFFYNGPNIGTVLKDNLLLAFEDQEPISPITADHNGSWYYPEHDGQGINFEIINHDNTMIGYWYTYQPNGGEQRWFSLQGDVIEGKAIFNIYSTTGGKFVNPQQIERVFWGTGTLEIYNCTTGLFTFESNNQTVNEDINGEFPLTRITVSSGQCQNNIKKQQSMGYDLR